MDDYRKKKLINWKDDYIADRYAGPTDESYIFDNSRVKMAEVIDYATSGERTGTRLDRWKAHVEKLKEQGKVLVKVRCPVHGEFVHLIRDDDFSGVVSCPLCENDEIARIESLRASRESKKPKVVINNKRSKK